MKPALPQPLKMMDSYKIMAHEINFCFGVCSDRDMVKCAQSGFDEFVSKPLTLDKLVDRLKKINPDSAANYGLNS